MAMLERAFGLTRANVRLTWQVTWLPQDSIQEGMRWLISLLDD
jgi:metal-sulfur cluster biosynthetic enzyme